MTATAYGVQSIGPPSGLTGDGVYVQVAWNDSPNVFTIGTSTLSGTDVMAGVFPLEAWTDETANCQTATISRGRQDATSPIQQSTCTVTVVDTTGKYNAANPSSSLYGKLTPSRPMRVFVRYKSVEYDLWTGVTSEIVAAPSRHDPYATISGVDLLERLAQEEPTIPTVASTTTGAAIGLVLDAVGWWGARRSLATGDQIIKFGTDTAVADLTQIDVNGAVTMQESAVKALDLINQLLDHEGGIFFMDASGNATYQPYQGKATVDATVTSPNLITPGVSISSIYNRCQATASQGALQEYVDGASAGRHGPRDIPNSPINAPWLPDELAAATLCQRLVAINQTNPIWGLTLQKGDLSVAANRAIYTDMIALDIGDRVTLNDPASGTQGDYLIQGVTHTIQAGGLDHETTWVLRMMPVHVFTIGQSVLDGTDTLGA